MPDTSTREAEGWAGFAAPEEAAVLLVPLTPQILKAGGPLADRAKARAWERYGDLGVAQDILIGNALFALRDGRDAVGTIAACLGAIGHLTQSRCYIATAVMRGGAVDCDLERLDRPATPPKPREAVRKRLAELIGVPAKRVVPAELLRAERQD